MPLRWPPGRDKAVAQVMDAHVLDARFLPDRAPVFLDLLPARFQDTGSSEPKRSGLLGTEHLQSEPSFPGWLFIAGCDT
jgi:hypothetical protein